MELSDRSLRSDSASAMATSTMSRSATSGHRCMGYLGLIFRQVKGRSDLTETHRKTARNALEVAPRRDIGLPDARLVEPSRRALGRCGRYVRACAMTPTSKRTRQVSYNSSIQTKAMTTATVAMSLNTSRVRVESVNRTSLDYPTVPNPRTEYKSGDAGVARTGFAGIVLAAQSG